MKHCCCRLVWNFRAWLFKNRKCCWMRTGHVCSVWFASVLWVRFSLLPWTPASSCNPTYPVSLAPCSRKMSPFQTSETPPLRNSHRPVLSRVAFITFFIILWIIMYFLTKLLPNWASALWLFGGAGDTMVSRWWIYHCFPQGMSRHEPNLVPLYAEHAPQWLIHRICSTAVWWVSEWIYDRDWPWEQ